MELRLLVVEVDDLFLAAKRDQYTNEHVNDAKGLECTYIHLNITWTSFCFSPPHPKLFWGASLFNAFPLMLLSIRKGQRDAKLDGLSSNGVAVDLG